MGDSWGIDGKAVVVVGAGGGGIGTAICRHLGRAGATVVAVDVDAAKLQLAADALAADDSAHRTRYTAGTLDGRTIPDYAAEEGVDGARGTETLAELVVQLENVRWAGVPFVLRSGKALGSARKEVVVTFRPPAHLPSGLVDTGQPDQLVLELKPGGVVLDLSMNAEGDPFTLEQKELRAELGKPRMLPYGEILGAILDGDPLLSIRGDEAEELWRVVGPVLDAWRAGQVPLEEYPAGSGGPQGWGIVPVV